MKKNYLLFLAALLLAVTCGCRNHIKDIDSSMTDYERTVTRDLPMLQVLEADQDNCFYRLRITGNKDAEVKVFEVQNTISRFTPWSGWRELYEVPMGLVLVPVGLCSHVLNIATLGIFPYSWCWDLDCVSFAALNPCINIESDTRYQDEPLRSRRDQVDTRQENSVYAMHHTNVSLVVGTKIKHTITNNIGIAQFDLLDIKGDSIVLNNHDRELKIFVGTSKEPIFSRIISRSVRNRIAKASAAIKNYYKKPTGKTLHKTVILLEELKFTRLSYLLEKQELNARDKKFKDEFHAADIVK